MTTKSTRAPARRKTKSVSKSPIIYPLSRYEIEHRNHARASKELHEFIASLTEAEMRVVKHVRPFGDPVAGLIEIRRLLGESIAKCKVIPFPIKRCTEA